MAVKSSCLLNDFLEKVVKAIGDVDTPDPANYLGMGVGDDGAAAAATQHTLGPTGGFHAIYVTVTPTYEASYKVVFNHAFTYDEINPDLTANTIKEYCVCKNNTEFASGDLMCRVVVDDVVLGVGEQYDLTFKLEALETA